MAGDVGYPIADGDGLHHAPPGVRQRRLVPAQAIGQHYRAVAVRPDDSIVVLGNFSTLDGGERDIDIGVLQFDNGGSLDPAFSGDGVALLRYSSSVSYTHLTLPTSDLV